MDRYPEAFKHYLDHGHTVGNHSWDHPNGWKTGTLKYVENVRKCSEVVNSKLFRPPYGKISYSQKKALRNNYEIIMWTVLSRDYDARIDAKTCLEKTWEYTRPGALVLFHDSPKTIEKLVYVLPKYLARAKESGYNLKGLKVEG